MARLHNPAFEERLPQERELFMTTAKNAEGVLRAMKRVARKLHMRPGTVNVDLYKAAKADAELRARIQDTSSRLPRAAKSRVPETTTKVVGSCAMRRGEKVYIFLEASSLICNLEQAKQVRDWLNEIV